MREKLARPPGQLELTKNSRKQEKISKKRVVVSYTGTQKTGEETA